MSPLSAIDDVDVDAELEKGIPLSYRRRKPSCRLTLRRAPVIARKDQGSTAVVREMALGLMGTRIRNSDDNRVGTSLCRLHKI
ncbi:hypothetical protein C6558_37755 [Ensifer sp. NM-2]|nr:hypothetical protein C6558_37755 [Ensifer sp. NM-2]